ncbi:MAG: aconitase/3-isopropylmalate dehydratase large subunit family protein [Phycisphaerae bacterium]|jgi:3-isopropylmalate/(R)-2-methylmalate dehydratase large subunit|nr:aconitase/3-isopropylmalate dehydratase large subunit family protein [Phycisphaerae bacterium]
MGMTITEKILARHAERDSVTPGENIWCNVDVLMTHDVCGPGTIGIFEEHFGAEAKVFDSDKIVIMPDHYIFTADPKAHRNLVILREFVKRQGIKYFYDADFVAADQEGVPAPYTDPDATKYVGVCHVGLPQQGHTRPGELLLGTDSHTCTHGAFGQFATGIGNTDAGFVMGAGKLWLKVPESQKFVFNGVMPPYLMAKDLILHVIGQIGVDGATYQAMEFAGDAVMSLNIDERCTICNMAIEAGGKSGIIAPDEVTERYVRARALPGAPEYQAVYSDDDAVYAAVTEFDTATIEPTVACPHSPDKRATARELDVKIDRSYIGSCTGGKTTDFIAAATVLAGRKVAVDTYIVPATIEVEQDLERCKVGDKSLREIFVDAGCLIGPAGCAACLGGPSDTFGRANEAINVVSTTNRNFPGRMGCKEAGVYLASPLTAAASAITGKITDPRDYLTCDKAIGIES